jgi:hypothetical protein
MEQLSRSRRRFAQVAAVLVFASIVLLAIEMGSLAADAVIPDPEGPTEVVRLAIAVLVSVAVGTTAGLIARSLIPRGWIRPLRDRYRS